MKKKLIIDIPNYLNGEFVSHVVQEKVFEFIDRKDMDYIANYEILIRHYDSGNSYLRDLIDDWKLSYRQFVSVKENPTNGDKVKVIKGMVKECEDGYALIFYSYNDREQDIGNKILLDQCSNNEKIRSSVCRIDFDYNLY